jgi:hypothetical protein
MILIIENMNDIGGGCNNDSVVRFDSCVIIYVDVNHIQSFEFFRE